MTNGKTSFLRSVLVAGAHASPCHFADLDSFVEYVLDAAANRRTNSSSDILDVLAELAAELSARPLRTSDDALAHLVSDDLRGITNSLGNINVEEFVRFDVDRILEDAIGHLNELGLQPRYVPVVKIVDTFPSPFEDADWSAMAPDEDDRQRYGIEPGIYFRQDRAFPVFVHVMIAHELIHCVPRDVIKGTFGMGLEEGLADLVGFMHIGAQLLTRAQMLRAFVYYRLSPQTPRLRKLYVDHDRLALSILQSQGLHELLSLLSRGRKVIRRAEQTSLSAPATIETAVHEDHSAASWNLLECADWLLNRYLPNLVMPPLARIILSRLHPGACVPNIADDLGISRRLLADAVQTASTNTQLFLLEDNSEVGYSNIDLYLDSDADATVPMLRYQIGE